MHFYLVLFIPYFLYVRYIFVVLVHLHFWHTFSVVALPPTAVEDPASAVDFCSVLFRLHSRRSSQVLLISVVSQGDVPSAFVLFFEILDSVISEYFLHYLSGI
ncbi:hypothetical protein IHE45_10G024200 [Dioscorea alata]|uniref:Uncharacterized protein n=1 Tax=Dioscorea alata TaxID=55571 RepID=A0ACB7V9I3_DIOAL|nr:hypothetical protein IHE45_10G024200 [Dioscorea alata]